MKLIVVCHLENDIRNKWGVAKNLPQDKQSFQHIPMLLEWFSKIDIPITMAVMVAGQVGGKLLQNQELRDQSRKDNFEFGIHYHSEKFVNNRWTYQDALSENEYLDYYNQFKNALNISPSSVVFGKWKIDKKSYPLLKKLGITHDGSKVLQGGITESPQDEEGLISVPVVSYNGRPVNPLTRFSDFLLVRKIITEHHKDNILVHFAFHSYDFFSFANDIPKWRAIKKKIFMNIINMALKHESEILNLKNCKPGSYESLQKLHVPILAKISQLFGH